MAKNKYPEGLTPHEKCLYRNTSVTDTGITNEQGELVAVVSQNQFGKKLNVDFVNDERVDAPALPGSNQYVVRIKHPETDDTIKLKRDQENGSISEDL